MPRYCNRPLPPADAEAPFGVLLINLGTPDAPTPAALRRYLAQFLSDPRVVEAPRLPWWLLLHGVILRTRPRRSAALYRKIWSAEGSPLLCISRAQAALLEERLRGAGPARPVKVALGMRYGNPSIAAALEELDGAGVERVVVLPLYPQYSAATTASSFDALFAELARRRRVPELHLIGDYHIDQGYLDALAASVREHWAQAGEPERLLLSFHGIPLRYYRNGDPYPDQCRATAHALARALGLEPGRWALAFQSRFGREEWVGPYTDVTLRRWAGETSGRVDVLCPGFAADCLETLEEIGGENREAFLEAGGAELSYIPALNDREIHISALAALVERRLRAWTEPPGGCL